MPAIAIVGAGPGLGYSIGKEFGRRGYSVALISRTQGKLDAFSKDLAAEGIDAAGFAADVMDRESLEGALHRASHHFGGIDVLEYSPHRAMTFVAPAAVTVESLQQEIEYYLHGAVTATLTVLPKMLDANAGTLLYTTGGGAISPYPQLATMNAAQAAMRNWTLNLHNTLSDRGIHVANVAINVMIGGEAPEGVPHRHPDAIAPLYWELHTNRDVSEQLVNP